MATRYLVINDVTGTRAAGGPVGSSGGFSDQDYDVGGGGRTTFTTAASFTSGSVIDVFRNGVLVREGALNEYTRNAGTSQIIFNYTVGQNGWVRIRIYS